MEASAPPAQDAGGKVDKGVVPIKLKRAETDTCWRVYLVDPTYDDIIEFLHRCVPKSWYFTYIDADQDAISVSNAQDWDACLTYWRRSGGDTLYLAM